MESEIRKLEVEVVRLLLEKDAENGPEPYLTDVRRQQLPGLKVLLVDVGDPDEDLRRLVVGSPEFHPQTFVQVGANGIRPMADQLAPHLLLNPKFSDLKHSLVEVLPDTWINE